MVGSFDIFFSKTSELKNMAMLSENINSMCFHLVQLLSTKWDKIRILYNVRLIRE